MLMGVHGASEHAPELGRRASPISQGGLRALVTSSVKKSWVTGLVTETTERFDVGVVRMGGEGVAEEDHCLNVARGNERADGLVAAEGSRLGLPSFTIISSGSAEWTSMKEASCSI